MEIYFQFVNINDTTANAAEFTVMHALCTCVCLNVSVRKSLRFKDEMDFQRLYEITFLLKMFFKKHIET